MKFFSPDSGIYKFMSKFTDVLLLNLLWFVCCIPIITIGASTTAAFSVSLKMADEDDGYITKDFFKSFKKNFKQGTGLWLIILACIYVVYLDWSLIGALKNPPLLLLIISVLAVVIFTLSLFYSFPLLARYENSITQTIKNSFFISIRFILRTIGLLLLFGFLVYFFMSSSIMIFFGILVGPVFIIFTMSVFCLKIFKKIEATEQEES